MAPPFPRVASRFIVTTRLSVCRTTLNRRRLVRVRPCTKTRLRQYGKYCEQRKLAVDAGRLFPPPVAVGWAISRSLWYVTSTLFLTCFLFRFFHHFEDHCELLVWLDPTPQRLFRIQLCNPENECIVSPEHTVLHPNES